MNTNQQPIIPDDPTKFIELCHESSLDNLMAIRNEITYRIARIQIQLDSDILNPNLRQRDATWTAKAKSALRYSSWRLTTVDKHILDRKRQDYLLTQHTYEHLFLETARQLLSPDIFHTIHEETKAACSDSQQWT